MKGGDEVAHMVHPKTGLSVRIETVCEQNPPDYEHDFETVVDNWAERILRCKRCGIREP